MSSSQHHNSSFSEDDIANVVLISLFINIVIIMIWYTNNITSRFTATAINPIPVTTTLVTPTPTIGVQTTDCYQMGYDTANSNRSVWYFNLTPSCIQQAYIANAEAAADPTKPTASTIASVMNLSGSSRPSNWNALTSLVNTF